MASIIPLPSTRVSSMLVRQRLLAQMQGDQLDLFRLQNQVSTGQRFTLPSEDAPAARRAMTLQRLLERKSQIGSNIETGQSFLKSTDVALNNVAGLLGDIRGLALGVSGTTSTDTERQAAITEINRAIEQLVSVGNTQFRGRYLFAGSQTNVEPYSYDGANVTYKGDNKSIQAYSDLGVLFSTNASGQSVFGGISNEVLGGIDLNPEITSDTPLSSLRGGKGISANGAIQVSDGTNSSIVDISHAATVGDVVRLIEANPPAGRRVSATITGQGLTLQLDPAGGGNLSVKEVNSGKAASELGILNTVGTLTNPLVGTDLNPLVTKTTSLSSLLGAKAQTRLESAGSNNDLLIRASVNGPQYNGATVQFVDDELLRATPGVPKGSEYAQYSTTARAASASLQFSGTGNDLTLTANAAGTAFNNVNIVVNSQAGLGSTPSVNYNASSKQLTVTIDSAAGTTTVGDVMNAINAEGTFTATPDLSAEGVGSHDPLSFIQPSDALNVQGNTGNSGGAANTLYVFIRNNASSANNVAAAINAQGTFNATIDASDTAFAAQAGTQPVSVNATATLSGGSGEPLDLASGIRVVSGEATYTLSFNEAKTVEDMLNIINGSDAGLQAEINADGSGINLRSRLSGANLQIGENGGRTASQLGIRSFNGDTRLADLNRGAGVPTRRDAYQQNIPDIVNDFTIAASDGVGGTVNLDIDTAGAKTVQDVIALINGHASNNTGGVQITATLSADGNGIDLTDGGGQPYTITTGGQTAPAGFLSNLPNVVNDFRLTLGSGPGATHLDFDVSAAKTVQDVIDQINNRPENSPTPVVAARLNATGNGIEIINLSGNPITVTASEGSQAAEYLGLVAPDATSATSASGTLSGTDKNYLDTPSVFTTLIRLKDALGANDIKAIEDAISGIDADLERVTFSRSEVGARQQALDVTQKNLEDEDVQLRTALSDEMEVDLVEAISNLTARQVSLEASLRVTGSILQMSLLNYL
ncbi:flagellar hook-associated protein FlgL [Lacipirellula sp.]|uniref:flagellar hook-associated protein FlgL n=1 Tax=Lacipirellula sp. TaxID=2691419 RepID=UPI003D0E21EB